MSKQYINGGFTMKTIFTYFFIIIFAVSAFQTMAQQEVLYLDAVNPVFSVIFPNDWVVGNKDGKFEVTTPDEDMKVYLWELKDKKMDDAIKESDKIAALFLDNVNLGKPQKTSKRKIELTEMKGSAQENGNSVDVTVSLFEARKRVLVVMYYAPGSVVKNYKEDINKFMNTIAAK